MPDISLHRGKFLELRQRNHWEYVHRIRGQTPVGIAALTPDQKILLISQFRVPLQKTIIEIPAGLVGDKPGEESEPWQLAAQRELLEETGWAAEKIEFLAEGPTSAGLTSECIKLVRATGLTKRGNPTPDGDEQIQVHEIPLTQVDNWLAEKVNAGQLIDPKVYAALYFLSQSRADAPVGY
ncbi:MAG: NUDIX hydrolase [Phycisphaerae bacterium]